MNQYLHLLIAITVLLFFHFGMKWLKTKTRHPFGRTIHLFIHRWFGGSAHPKAPWKRRVKVVSLHPDDSLVPTYEWREVQFNYPRLANWFVSTVLIGIALSWTPYWVVPAWFGVVLVLMFLYCFYFGLDDFEWYDCYRKYWRGRGYGINPSWGEWNVCARGVCIRFRVTKLEAIQRLRQEIFAR